MKGRKQEISVMECFQEARLPDAAGCIHRIAGESRATAITQETASGKNINCRGDRSKLREKMRKKMMTKAKVVMRAKRRLLKLEISRMSCPLILNYQGLTRMENDLIVSDNVLDFVSKLRGFAVYKIYDFLMINYFFFPPICLPFFFFLPIIPWPTENNSHL